MLYRLLHFILKQSVAAHYLEVKESGFTTIPKKDPLIIAASHPNSFLDAIIIAILINRPLHFIARSDVFNNKLSNYILRQFNLIPIYRLEEGLENLNKNEKTFSECFDILKQGGAILIFAEGVSVIDKKLRPLKKGLARVAFGFGEKNNFQTTCHIAPVAINYDRPTEFRSKVLVAVGKIFQLSNFKNDYQKNAAKGIRKLNLCIHKELEEHTIQVKDEDMLIYKAITELDSCYEQNSLSRKKIIADHISKAEHINNKELEKLSQYTKSAFSILKKYGLNFRKLKANYGISIKSIFLIALGLPLAIMAFLLNFLPFLLTKLIADSKVKAIEFYASVRFALGTILWIIWVIGLTLFAMSFSLWFIFTPLLLYLLLQYYLKYYERAKYLIASFKLKKLKNKSEDYDELQSLIKNIYRLRTSLGLSPKA